MTEQPPPIPNSSRPIWEMVVEDMQARDRVGRERYGVPLQAFNGRDALQDAYEEELDKIVYLRQEIEERAARDEDTRNAEQERIAVLIERAHPWVCRTSCESANVKALLVSLIRTPRDQCPEVAMEDVRN